MYAAFVGTTDADCAIWDHVVQLFVCCDDGEPSSSSGGGSGGAEWPCDKCDSTVWLAAHHPGTVSHREPLNQGNVLSQPAKNACACSRVLQPTVH